MAKLEYSHYYYTQCQEHIKRLDNLTKNFLDEYESMHESIKNVFYESPAITLYSVYNFNKLYVSCDALYELIKKMDDLFFYEYEIIEKYNNGIQNGEVDEFTSNLMKDVSKTYFYDPVDFSLALDNYYKYGGDSWEEELKGYIAAGFIKSDVIDMEAYLDAIKRAGAYEVICEDGFLIEGEETIIGGGGGGSTNNSWIPGDTSWSPVESSPTSEPTPSGSNDSTPTGSKDPKPSGSGDQKPSGSGDPKPSGSGDPKPSGSGDPKPSGSGEPNLTPTRSDYVPDSTPTGSFESTPTSGFEAENGTRPGPAPEPGHSGGGYSGGGYTPSGDGEDAVVPDSIEDVIDDAKSYTKIPRQIKIDGKDTKTSGGSVVPIIAGLTSVGAAGLGAKAYLDHKNNQDEEEDEEFTDEYNDSSNSEFTEYDASNDEWFNDDFS